MSRGSKIGLLVGILGSLAGLAVAGLALVLLRRPEPPREPLPVRLDTAGPYLILASRRAAALYSDALARAQALHPDAGRLDFDPADLAPVLAAFRQKAPRYALVFLEPDELDVTFHWRWLDIVSRVDDDPFVDVRTGFITGATPAAADALVARTAAAVEGRLVLPGALVDNLGPPEQPGAGDSFRTMPGSVFLPAFSERLACRSVMHGPGSFRDDRLDSLAGCGLVHFGGHGHPDRIDDGVTAAQAARLTLAPCIVFNGACYTGVTRRWYDLASPQPAARDAAADASFCLALLRNQPVAALAAQHPDHGIPVYQEMEYLAWHGGSLGDVIKHTHDAVVLGSGGRLPAFPRLDQGAAPPRTPADVMLQGTAARVLFGDPALVVGEPFTRPPFDVTVAEKDNTLEVRATVANTALKSTFTDTFFNDLNPAAPFNDRALVTVDLPEGCKGVGEVRVAAIRAGGKDLGSRLVGHAVEHDGGRARLQVQVDVPADGFQQSPLRTPGAVVELVVQPVR